jgi:hypothetical protein
MADHVADHVDTSGTSSDSDSDQPAAAAAQRKRKNADASSPEKRKITFDRWHRGGSFEDLSQRTGFIESGTFTCHVCRVTIKVGNKLSNFTKNHLDSPS